MRTPSAGQYRGAFAAIRDRIKPDQRLLLLHHYHAPDHTITARRLAEQVWFPDWHRVNRRYGKLAHHLCDALGVPAPPQAGVWVSVLATWTRDQDVDDGELQLVMRPQVAQALAALGWAW
jgi:hypothetical protein